MPAEEPPVQREEAAGVVDDLLIGELTEVWAARDQPIDLVTVCSQLGQVVAGEEVVEVALELRRELFVLVVGSGLVLVRGDAGHVAEVLEVDHLRGQAGRAQSVDARHRHVQVEVAPEDADGVGPIGVELVIRERARLHVARRARPRSPADAMPMVDDIGDTGSGITSPAFARV